MWVRTVCVFHKTLSDLQRQLLGKTRRKRYEVVRRGLGSAKKTTNEDLSWKKCCVIFFIYRCERLPQECQRCVWPASDWWCARCTWSKRSEEVHRFSQMLTFTQIRQRERETYHISMNFWACLAGSTQIHRRHSQLLQRVTRGVTRRWRQTYYISFFEYFLFSLMICEMIKMTSIGLKLKTICKVFAWLCYDGSWVTSLISAIVL